MKQNRSGKKWLLVLVVLAFIGGGIALFYYLPTSKPVKPPADEETPPLEAPEAINNANDGEMELPDLPLDQRPSITTEEPQPTPSQDQTINAPSPQRPQPLDLLREDDDVIPPPPPGMESDPDQSPATSNDAEHDR